MAGAYRSADATAPAFDGRVITPSDVTSIAGTRSVYVGSGGDISVRMVSGTVLTFYGVQTGSVLPVQVDMVRATDTTASQLIALY